MKYYAVLDTNVIVSAMLRWQSVPGSVVELAFDGVIVPVLNDEIVDEYRKVLARPKFHLTSEIVEDVIADLTEHGVFVDADALEWDMSDLKDKVFYEVVMEERKTEDAYLVTGNIRHFPVKPFVETPRQMLDIIIGDTLNSEIRFIHPSESSTSTYFLFLRILAKKERPESRLPAPRPLFLGEDKMKNKKSIGWITSLPVCLVG